MAVHVSKNCLAAMGFALAAVLLCGCPTGEYNERVEAKLGQLGKNSAFNALSGGVAIPGSPFSVRIPKSMATVQAKLPFTTEGMVKLSARGSYPDANKNEIYYFVHFSAGPSPEPDKNPAIPLLGGIAVKLDQMTPTWNSVDCPTPQGATVRWKCARVTGPQDFPYKDKSGKEQNNAKTDGIIDVWALRDDQAKSVAIIVWRVPKALEKAIGLEEMEKKVAGSLSTK